MFAKLVTTASNTVSANVFFNTLINVITGSITSNSQLDTSTFIQGASYIVNTTPSGWSLVDSQANSPGTSWVLPGCAPVVVAAPWTDASNTQTQQKFLYLAATNFNNNNIIVTGVPIDYYSSNSSGKYYYNALNSNASPSSTLLANTTTRTQYDVVSFMSPPSSTNGFVTIVSATSAHLLIATYTGYLQNGFNNYYFLSEYSRDDPWNTIGNGYPSWFVDVCSNNQGWASLTTSNVNIGYTCRTLNTATNVDLNWAPMWNAATGGNWGLASRAVPYGQMGISQVATGTFLPRGLSSAGQGQHFIGNQTLVRDVNKNASGLLSEIRLIPLSQGTSFGSNTMFAGGSVSAVNQSVYLFRSQYNTFDELLVGSNTYMNLIMNMNLPGTTNASCVLVLEK